MSLARAFTKRAKREHEVSASPPDPSFRYAAGTIKRSKISLPTEFLSTTNVHALSAPDIRSISSASSNTSLRSADGSDFSSMAKSFLSSPATSSATSSPESSPVAPESAQHKALFSAATANSSPQQPATTAAASRSSSGTDSNPDIPAVPRRALSHSKKAHQELARKRSLSRLTPPPTTTGNATVVRSSAEIFRGAAVDLNHPFGNELAQVNEVAEEFGGVNALLDEEEEAVRMRGLMKFNAQDYVNEILGLCGGVFEDRLTAVASPWI